MKKISKICLLLLVGIILTTVSGCGTKKEYVKGNLEDIMEKLYSNISEDNLPMYLENQKVNDENIESFIGTKDVDYEEIIASESMTGSTAHSVVLIRTKKNADVEKIKKTIKEKVNPRKWICVGVEREEVIVKSKGDLIVVIIVADEENRNQISKNFDNLK